MRNPLVWLLFSMTLFSTEVAAYPPLQLFINLTPPGGVLRLEPGTYSGPAVLDRPITLEGGGQAVIDGGGEGTVLTVRADNSVVRGVRITHSGSSHDQVDAGLLLEAHETLIEDNRFDDVLFGIHLKKAHGNTIRHNQVRSRPLAPTLRGEGLRLWQSSENRIEDNQFQQVRDLYLTNSTDNLILGNTIRDSRVAMELVFSHGNRIEGNRIEHNGRGIVVLYSNELQIRNNQIQHLRDFTGFGLSLKESSQVVIENNRFLHCALAVSANAPIHPENTFRMSGNHFVFNDIALYFYGEKGGHQIHGNRFKQNLQTVAVSAPSSALRQDWLGNQWDDYQGFDLNRDGIGDQPHEVYLYADRLWMDRPMTRFFRGSLLMEMLDFLERLTAFSDPALILRDPSPALSSVNSD